MKRGIISILFAMFVLFLWSVPAKATLVTIPYEFVQDESILTVIGWGIRPKYFSIDGQFDMTVDFDLGIASFDNVNATLSGEVYYCDYPACGLYTDNLDILFKLTEIGSVYVSDTQIDFYLDRTLPMFPDSNIRLSVTFVGDSLNMTGYFSSPVYDGASYTLNATAVVVPEPGTLLLLSFGGIMLRRRYCVSYYWNKKNSIKTREK